MAGRVKPAAIFLWVIAGLIVITLAIFAWIQADPARALRIAFTPGDPFTAISSEPLDYTDDANWAALPSKDSFAKGRPAGEVSIAVVPDVDVFFVHPTTYLSRDSWNAPLDAADANLRLEKRVLKMQASAFNLAGNIYAPRYRQATFGAFFDNEGDGLQALVFAYSDVLNAFDQFIADRNEGRPFILAGHSQGSLHLLSLLQQRLAGSDLAERMVATYIVGWPVSVEADLGAMPGIEACQTATDTQCVVSYQTFGPDGDAEGIKAFFESSTSLAGLPRAGTQMLCTNPLTWTIDGAADADANIGAQARMGDDDPLGEPIVGLNGAACDADGFLVLENEPGEAWQEFKMSGENFHVYDYHKFFGNIRTNATARVAAWKAANSMEAN
ncbi:MAG: DUF3089 domain-containing protein [Kordiimonadaceae bacterium]|nr:DUF3089 domain-containing protein [Kordiimonadaceae bacterium]MBO6569887.1 DUF3089 domain-containing protein [Kordiimonadaceae bacterium]MBO6966017.1 DUF3089 domain-containing protein [Kordiimonadaceae bacterium]